MLVLQTERMCMSPMWRMSHLRALCVQLDKVKSETLKAMHKNVEKEKK